MPLIRTFQPQHSSGARLGYCFHNISKWSDFLHRLVSQWVSFLRHRGTSAETSPALTLSDFADAPKITDRSFFHPAPQMN